ncbi:MAG TPA: penicillin-binding transpeptidase domain-containing protein [Patescibacteria group bacterium]|nr:penicillin-binding transpeptidase domain-containing protein [Patescibacteria group bacterium]
MKHGIAFPDSIRTEKISRRHRPSFTPSSMRAGTLLVVLVIVLAVLLFKIISLQIVRGAYYRNLSDSNRIRTKTIYAPRGVLFDRNNVPLVYNIPGFRETSGNKTKLLSRDQALDLLAKGDQHISVDSLREYPFKDSMAHVIGYLGQITADQLKSPQYSGYSITDLIGESGLEYQYENFLRGVNGKQLIEVDATGKEVRVLGQTDPIAGQNLVLTLDSKLQQAAYSAMHGVQKGAVVISTPDGQILSMISKPSFDPNLFTLDSSYKATDTAYPSIENILTGSSQPLLNRAISGTYPPGSTFKVVMAAGGLESHKIDENYQVDDKGKISIGPYSYSNWYFSQYGKTEGNIGVVRAIARSNDTFFYELAAKIGLNTIVQYAKKMGVGQILDIDLPGEAAGVLPDEAWKKKNIGEDWYLGDTYIFGIGQGYLLTTPLQVNAWTQVIANGGTLYTPHLLKNARPHVIEPDSFSEQTISLVRQGMVGACDTGGTAYPLFNFVVKNPNLVVDGRNIVDAPQASTSANFQDYRHVAIACKTGTAEHGDANTKPDAWLTLFAPAYNPQIVVTVLVEDSGEGSDVAAPIAKNILEYYFGSK